MSLHINRFLDRVKAAESRQQREVMIPMKDARDLVIDLTRLLAALEETRVSPTKTTEFDGGDIEIQGGSF